MRQREKVKEKEEVASLVRFYHMVSSNSHKWLGRVYVIIVLT